MLKLYTLKRITIIVQCIDISLDRSTENVNIDIKLTYFLNI